MTKKDYIKIAEVLNENEPHIFFPDKRAVWKGIRDAFSRMLKADNPAFNEDKFIDACSDWKGD